MGLMALIAGQAGPCAGVAPAPGPGPVVTGGGLVGVWRADYNDPFVGPATIELVLQPDGNFAKQTISAVSLTSISGPYFADFPAANQLRLTVHDWFPKEFCGPLGCTVIQPVAGETYIYTLIDANTLQLRDFYCVDGQGFPCTLTYVRTG
ncbi:MAG: hypothetical protein AMXMBFR13_43220 [Phycisphaerae bacterium]